VVEALKAMGETRAGKIILTDLYNIDSLVDAKSEDYLPVREAFERVFQR
jgi:ABC-type phosphate/phosphonate transport system substrate-binding protein